MKKLGVFVIILSWMLLINLIVLVGLELYLKYSHSRSGNIQSYDDSNYAKLASYYKPFAQQYINPFYSFFFPLDPKERRKLNNVVCNISDDGFRGATPSDRGNKKLAFLLGGSAAFGWYSSNDNTTITGYLNALQDEYLFVNAGVPSWNSTQELYRLFMQLVEYKPRLVVAYDGSNDATIFLIHRMQGFDYPPGTPENFGSLYKLFEGARGKLRRKHVPIYDRLFPNVSALLRQGKSHLLTFLGFRKQESKSPNSIKESIQLDDASVYSAARRYLLNIKLMKVISDSINARFIGIFQPILTQHKNIPLDITAEGELEKRVKSKFYHFVLDYMPEDIEYYDFVNIFDKYFKKIPVFNGDNELEEQIFVDNTHITDLGNKLVAEKILSIIKNSNKEDLEKF